MWIINKRSGVCLIHRDYGHEQFKNLDADLFSGLLTAIINFSEEISGGDYVKSVAMGANKFFYKISKHFVIALSMEERFYESDAKPILDHILNSFVKLEYADLALKNPDIRLLVPFKNEIDTIVNDAITILKIRQEHGDLLKDQYLVSKKVETPELVLKKQKIEDAIENAEWALASGIYKDAIIYFQVAEELFKEMKEMDMAKWCQNMIEETRRLEHQGIEVAADATIPPIEEIPPPISPEPTKIVEGTLLPIKPIEPIIPIKPIKVVKPIEPIKVAEPIKITKPIKVVTPIKTIKPIQISKEPPQPITEETSTIYYQKIPYLLKPLDTKKKFPLLESKVIRLCDGSHTIKEICDETKINRIKINEILRKYHKKKIIGLKRTIL